MYRKLYQEVAQTIPESIDFNLNAEKYKDEVESWFKVFFSITLRLFHGVMFGVIVLATLTIISSGGF